MNALFGILMWSQLFFVFVFVTGSDSSTGSNETFSPSFMQVVKISGLCKLSVFLIVMENSLLVQAVSGM